MTIRSVRMNDYEALVDIWNTVYPQDIYSAKEFKYLDDSIEEPCKFGRIVAEKDGTVVGSASYYQHEGMYHPNKFFMQLWVHPKHEKQGIGSSLFEALLKDLEAFDPISVRVNVRENLAYAVRFAQALGFKETKRDWESKLTISEYDPAKFEALESKAGLHNIVIKSVADFDDQEAIGRQFFDCFNLVRKDVPRSEPATDLSWDFFKKQVLDAPDFFPEGTLLAFHDNEAIGLTQLWKGESSDDLYTGLTAVKKEHRGKGVATALKLKALRLAKSINAQDVYTDNETSNFEMISINDKLGFKKMPASLSMLKVFRTE